MQDSGWHVALLSTKPECAVDQFKHTLQITEGAESFLSTIALPIPSPLAASLSVSGLSTN
jgi:hypothetical protein